MKIEPHLGKLREVSGAVPHPDGMIRVKIHPDGTDGSADVELPQNVTGNFVWEGRTTPLHGGAQHLNLTGAR